MILTSTRGGDEISFLDAAQRGTAPDGGLYLPRLPKSFDDIDFLLDGLDREARRVELMHRLLGDELGREELAADLASALDFPLPIIPVEAGGRGRAVFALELFHGPSLAFKDFGARFLARVLARIRQRDGRDRTILTATSGDTGAAVANAFLGLPGFRVFILYPEGGVSAAQEAQFASLGGNIHALAVRGSFDDCQAIVKAAFADRWLCSRHNLCSANSINIARLLAQILYYFDALALLRRRGCGQAPVISVPSGNFGNLCAGLLARELGLPAKRFVVATNANDTVPSYLDTGNYRARPSVHTISNAMDVGSPSNWERIERLFGGPGPEALTRLRGILSWGSVEDSSTGDALRKLDSAGYLADPHGAVAWKILVDKLEEGETGLFLATAHPGKFADILEPILGRAIAIPDSLAENSRRPLFSIPLTDGLAGLQKTLDEGANA